jgi:hypothetical protein
MIKMQTIKLQKLKFDLTSQNFGSNQILQNPDIHYLHFALFSDISFQQKNIFGWMNMQSIAKLKRLGQVVISYYGITKKSGP